MSQQSIDRVDGGAFARTDVDGAIMRMFMHGAGLSEAMVARRPVVGIANSWSELNPCNLGLRELAAAVKRGVLAAGGWPLEFPTISLSEPFLRPTSLFLRNLMAVDVEEMISASPLDAVVLLGGCDKTIPAQLMGAASANKPACAVAAGPRAPWRRGERVMTIDDLWPIAADWATGELPDEEWRTVQRCLNGGVGTCNVMGTATTMAIVAEVIGVSLPGSALLPATSAGRIAAAEHTGARAVALAEEGCRPSEVITGSALRNAVRVLSAVGGSTNVLIHLIGLAGRLGLALGLEEVAEIMADTPLLVGVRPTGHHLLEELEAAGGVPAIMRELGDLCDDAQRCGTGETWAEVVARTAQPASPVLASRDRPLRPAGGLVVLSGSLAPRGALLKRAAAAPELLAHRGPAIVFDGVADMRRRIDDPHPQLNRNAVLILRGVGPVGGPGMPEVGAIPIPRRLRAEGVRDMVRISDARISGTAAGTMIVHVAPEAAVGGPLALVRDGDEIELDADAGRLELHVAADELACRSEALVPPAPPPRGYERLHAVHVLQADEGCDFDFLRAAART